MHKEKNHSQTNSGIIDDDDDDDERERDNVSPQKITR